MAAAEPRTRGPSWVLITWPSGSLWGGSAKAVAPQGGGIFQGGVQWPATSWRLHSRSGPESDKAAAPEGEAWGPTGHSGAGAGPRGARPDSPLPAPWPAAPLTHHPVFADDHGHDDLVLEVHGDEQRRPDCGGERSRGAHRCPVPPGPPGPPVLGCESGAGGPSTQACSAEGPTEGAGSRQPPTPGPTQGRGVSGREQPE